MRRGTKNNDCKLSAPEQKSIAGVVLESRSARIELVGKRQFVISIIIIINIIIIKSSSNIKHHFVNRMYIRWLTSLCQRKPPQQPIRYINLKRSKVISENWPSQGGDPRKRGREETCWFSTRQRSSWRFFGSSVAFTSSLIIWLNDQRFPFLFFSKISKPCSSVHDHHSYHSKVSG